MTGKRLNIGLITSGFHDDYSNSVCRGVLAAAEEFDCNLFIFPCRFIDYKVEADSPSDQNLSRQYNTTASYATEKHLDLIIISTGAIFKDPHGSVVQDFFASFGDILVISLAVQVDGYPYVCFDCTDGLASVVRHIIRAHGCRKLAFIAGPKNHSESNSRLKVFRQVLESFNVPFDEDNILYADLSEFSHKKVSRFLKAHNFDFDAVCCANDATASVVYKVLQDNGLRPGVDIIVTGYDNLSFAASCIPALTTVSADAADSAHRAAASGIEALRSGRPIESITLSTYPVFRESCCGVASLTNSEAMSDAMEEMDTFIGRWISRYSANDDYSMPRFINSHSREFLRLLFAELRDPNLTEISTSRLLELFNSFVLYTSVDTMSANTVGDFLRLAYHVAMQRAQTPQISSQVNALFVRLFCLLNGTANTTNYSLTAEARQYMMFSNNISQHSIHFESGMDSIFTAVLEQLSELGIYRSYLYISAAPRAVSSLEDIRPFDKLELVAYHDECGSHPMFNAPVRVDSSDIIRNSYMSDGERSTMLVAPIFSAREQYGVMVCEISINHLSLFQNLILQISSEIETAYLVSRLNNQLSKTTSENLILSKMATRDSLTGSYNRHGFFERAGSAIISPLNDGRHGFLVFSDLNSLKEINDSYGHDDGDFALCQAARAMRDCLGRAGIVGRIGGDEFVALMITDDQSYTCEQLYYRIRLHLSQCSSESDKPYDISMSIGITDFICHEDLMLQPLIDIADQLQYLDKNNKPESINK